jgi:Txe/YoeB family toxin of Txe-Axe toxin-antitoxin module
MKPKEYGAECIDFFRNKFNNERNPEIAKKVKSTINKLKVDPYHKKSIKLESNQLKYFRRFRPNDIRVIYQVCGYCRNRGYTAILGKLCPPCEFPDDTVMFFYYGFRNDKKVYKDFEKMIPR